MEQNTLCEFRFFALPEGMLDERLADFFSDPALHTEVTLCDGETVLRAFGSQAGDPALHTEVTVSDGETVLQAKKSEALTAAVKERLGGYLYSDNGETLEQRAVHLLKERGLTVSTAESCTGGLVAGRLTAVAGCSAVFGTGIVSYSWDCKEKLLRVSPDTLAEYGAVSEPVAVQMARGARQASGAALGLSITGEAGPVPAEDRPVGTVFVALADKKRVWVRELHLDEHADRNTIRRTAASHALDLLRRYAEAYPAVMAGGRLQTLGADRRQIPKAAPGWRRLSAVLPWRGDSVRQLAVKSAAWILVLAILVGGIFAAYRYLLAPGGNRELQTGLGEMYHDETSDLTGPADGSGYPAGMKVQFRGLYDINNDVRGWLQIPDTALDYPVVAYRDGYYGNHNFSDQLSVYGQPYFSRDGEDAVTDGQVTLITGKNTGDGQMFSELLSYRRLAYLQEHNTVRLDTLYRSTLWEIFAVFVADERNKNEFDYTVDTFADTDERALFLRQIARRSLFSSDLVVGEENLLLLSTDAVEEYGFPGARLIVAARQITGDDIPDAAWAGYRVNPAVRMPQAYLDRHRTTTAPRRTTTTESIGTTSVTTVTDTTAPTEDVTTVTTTGEETTATVTTTTAEGETTTTAEEGETTTAEEKETTTSAQAEQTTEKTTAKTTKTTKPGH